MKRPSVQGMFLSFISQELPPWNVNPNSRRVTTNLAHKALDKQTVVEIFIPVSERSAKANRKRKRKKNLIIIHLGYKSFLPFIENKYQGKNLKNNLTKPIHFAHPNSHFKDEESKVQSSGRKPVQCLATSNWQNWYLISGFLISHPIPFLLHYANYMHKQKKHMKRKRLDHSSWNVL